MSGGFFDPPAPEPEPEPEPSPPWTGPPHGMVPGVAALELVLASNERAAVYTDVGGSWPAPGQPEGPVLWGMGGGGGGGRWRQDFWVWPLPPPGPVGLVCEWPAAGLALTRQDVDTQVLLDAAARARAIFPDERTANPGGTWSSYGVASTHRRADDSDT